MKKKIFCIIATPFFFVAFFLAVWADEGFLEACRQACQFIKDYDLSEIS